MLVSAFALFAFFVVGLLRCVGMCALASLMCLGVVFEEQHAHLYISGYSCVHMLALGDSAENS